MDVCGNRVVDHSEQAAFHFHAESTIRSDRFEAHRDAPAPASLRCRTAQGWHEAQVIQNHWSDVEDEGLCPLERLLDHRDELVELLARALGIALKQALHDLSLKRDVGDALGRSV